MLSSQNCTFAIGFDVIALSGLQECSDFHLQLPNVIMVIELQYAHGSEAHEWWWKKQKQTHVTGSGDRNFRLISRPSRLEQSLIWSTCQQTVALVHRRAKHRTSLQLLKCLALLWTLPTPHIFMVVGSAWELSHPVSNCKSCRFSFQVSESKLRCNSYSRSKWRFSSWIDYVGAYSWLWVHYWT